GEALHEQVARHGLLLSEFLPGTPPDRSNFVRRNRIIAALAQAVLVVEAPAKSGALTTVEHALDLNREVLAVPGPIGRESCEGSNRLLRDGAAVALEPADVLDQIGMGAAGARLRAMRAGSASRVLGSREARRDAARQRTPPADPVHAALWNALDWEEPLHVDVIAARARVEAPVAAAGLLELEIEGRVARGGGMTFRRIGRAICRTRWHRPGERAVARRGISGVAAAWPDRSISTSTCRSACDAAATATSPLPLRAIRRWTPGSMRSRASWPASCASTAWSACG